MSERTGSHDDDLSRALAWERAHPRKRRPAIARRDGHGSIEPSNAPADDEGAMHSDTPCDWPFGALGPDAMGDALAGDHRTCGEPVRREAADCRAAVQAPDEKSKRQDRELPGHLDPHDLAEAGWGVVVAAGMDHLLDHLEPLLTERKEQAGGPHQKGGLYREIVYQPNLDPQTFLRDELGEAPGTIDPAKVPYYLLLVGGPESLPWELQYVLGINHAVGRIAFDRPADYRRYAQAVVDAESFGAQRPKRATFLSVEEDRDPTTASLAANLVDPLSQRLKEFMAPWPNPDAWEIKLVRREAADKRGFARVLGGEATPGLALVSCHGLRVDKENPWQRQVQGALCCQRPAAGPPDGDHLFYGGDLVAGNGHGETPAAGMIAFLFACYGAGTPREDNFPHEVDGKTESEPRPASVVSEEPFVGALPQALLRAGALAVIGHVDRGWTLSFSWTLEGRHTDAMRSLEDSVKQLLRGHRLGHAMRALQRRYTAIAADLAKPTEALRQQREVDRKKLAITWTAHHDARNLVVLGDPAVYLLAQRERHPRFCCDPHTMTGRAPRSALRSADAVVLEPDALLLAERQARRAGVDLSSWVEAAIRAAAGGEAGGGGERSRTFRGSPPPDRW